MLEHHLRDVTNELKEILDDYFAKYNDLLIDFKQYLFGIINDEVLKEKYSLSRVGVHDYQAKYSSPTFDYDIDAVIIFGEILTSMTEKVFHKIATRTAYTLNGGDLTPLARIDIPIIPQKKVLGDNFTIENGKGKTIKGADAYLKHVVDKIYDNDLRGDFWRNVFASNAFTTDGGKATGYNDLRQASAWAIIKELSNIRGKEYPYDGRSNSYWLTTKYLFAEYTKQILTEPLEVLQERFEWLCDNVIGYEDYCVNELCSPGIFHYTGSKKSYLINFNELDKNGITSGIEILVSLLNARAIARMDKFSDKETYAYTIKHSITNLLASPDGKVTHVEVPIIRNDKNEVDLDRSLVEHASKQLLSFAKHKAITKNEDLYDIPHFFYPSGTYHMDMGDKTVTFVIKNGHQELSHTLHESSSCLCGVKAIVRENGEEVLANTTFAYEVMTSDSCGLNPEKDIYSQLGQNAIEFNYNRYKKHYIQTLTNGDTNVAVKAKKGSAYHLYLKDFNEWLVGIGFKHGIFSRAQDNRLRLFYNETLSNGVLYFFDKKATPYVLDSTTYHDIYLDDVSLKQLIKDNIASGDGLAAYEFVQPLIPTSFINEFDLSVHNFVYNEFNAKRSVASLCSLLKVLKDKEVQDALFKDDIHKITEVGKVLITIFSRYIDLCLSHINPALSINMDTTRENKRIEKTAKNLYIPLALKMNELDDETLGTIALSWMNFIRNSDQQFRWRFIHDGKISNDNFTHKERMCFDVAMFKTVMPPITRPLGQAFFNVKDENGNTILHHLMRMPDSLMTYHKLLTPFDKDEKQEDPDCKFIHDPYKMNGGLKAYHARRLILTPEIQIALELPHTDKREYDSVLESLKRFNYATMQSMLLEKNHHGQNPIDVFFEHIAMNLTEISTKKHPNETLTLLNRTLDTVVPEWIIPHIVQASDAKVTVVSPKCYPKHNMQGQVAQPIELKSIDMNLKEALFFVLYRQRFDFGMNNALFLASLDIAYPNWESALENKVIKEVIKNQNYSPAIENAIAKKEVDRAVNLKALPF